MMMAIPQKQMAGSCCKLKTWKRTPLGWKLVVKTTLFAPFLLLVLACEVPTLLQSTSSVSHQSWSGSHLESSIINHQSSLFLNGSESRRGERRKLRWIWWRIARYCWFVLIIPYLFTILQGFIFYLFMSWHRLSVCTQYSPYGTVTQSKMCLPGTVRKVRISWYLEKRVFPGTTVVSIVMVTSNNTTGHN